MAKLPKTALEVSCVTEPGYYWWLPVCAVERADHDDEWSIVSFHPNNPTRVKAGWLVGPLRAPVEKLENYYAALGGLTVRLGQLTAHASKEEMLFIAKVYKRALISEQMFETAAVMAEFIRLHEQAQQVTCS